MPIFLQTFTYVKICAKLSMLPHSPLFLIVIYSIHLSLRVLNYQLNSQQFYEKKTTAGTKSFALKVYFNCTL